MEVQFEDESFGRLEMDPEYTGGFDVAIVKPFRKRIQFIRAAPDERDFYAMKSLNFEKLERDRSGQYSMRLNKQWRLILKLEKRGNRKVAVVIEIVDYH